MEEESEDGLCMRLVATHGQRDHRVQKLLDRDLYNHRSNRPCRRGAMWRKLSHIFLVMTKHAVRHVILH